MIVLSNEEIEQFINIDECMKILSEAYLDLAHGKALNSYRVDDLAPNGRDDAYYAFKHMGGTWPTKKIQALRINSDIISHPVIEGKTRRVKIPLAKGRWVGLVELFSMDTGELLTIFPDGVVQRMRVGATNGLAANYLARPEASRVGLIGSGWQAGSQLAAILAVRPITKVKVYSLRRESREGFAKAASAEFGIAVEPVDSPEECLKDADIIMAATSSMVPVIKPEWLAPGVHISCIKPQEVSAELLDGCDQVVVHYREQNMQIDNIMTGTPNVSGLHLEGWWNQVDWQKFDVLPDLVAGMKPGRSSSEQITCFINNVGIGLQFAAVGSLVLAKAQARGIGTELPGEWFTESVHP